MGALQFSCASIHLPLALAEGLHTVSLWHMPPENGALEQRAELKGSSSVRTVLWHPSQPDAALSVEGAKLVHWRLGKGTAEVQ